MSRPAPVRADLGGRTCVVTGANSGIGLATATALARLGARVVMVCRSAERAEAARKRIVADTENPQVEVLLADLGHQASLEDAAGELVARGQPVHVLVNNAGVWLDRREESPDGIERMWATNVLGYFLLTERLRPLLRQGAPARIVNVASEYAGELDLEDVEFRRRRYSARTAYTQSKQANRLWTWALARRLEGQGVSANAMHPGGVDTPLLRQSTGGGGMGKTPEEGADTVVWLAASPAVEGVSGRFFVDRRDVPCRFRDTGAEEALWRLCEGMVRGSVGP